MSTRKKIPTHALVVVRTRPDGSTTRHEVARAEAPDREALAAAVAADPLLHEVRRGEIVEVTVDEAVARPVEMLAMLRAVGPKTAEDPSEWGEDVAEPWVETDDSGFEDAYGFDVVPRWVSVNGQRATGVLDETSTRRRLHLVLLGVDGWTVVPLSSVMESWYSDDGGSRVSGAGSRALVLLTPSLALQVAEGDYTDPTGILSWPSKRRARAELVVRWIQGIEAETAAALSLEPLDTTPLSTAKAEEWEELLVSAGVGFSLEGDQRLIDDVRAALDEPDSGYRTVREALAAPTGRRGRALAACLDAVADGERPLVDLLYGSWAQVPSRAAARTASYDTT